MERQSDSVFVFSCLRDYTGYLPAKRFPIINLLVHPVIGRDKSIQKTEGLSSTVQFECQQT